MREGGKGVLYVIHCWEKEPFGTGCVRVVNSEVLPQHHLPHALPQILMPLCLYLPRCMEPWRDAAVPYPSPVTL